MSRSEGWTWQAAAGADGHGPGRGRGRLRRALKGWGEVVVLTARRRIPLVLAGLGQVRPSAGPLVKAGEPVGRMAAAGQSTELYFEVRKNGAPVDPAPWLTGRSARPAP